MAAESSTNIAAFSCVHIGALRFLQAIPAAPTVGVTSSHGLRTVYRSRRPVTEFTLPRLGNVMACSECIGGQTAKFR